MNKKYYLIGNAHLDPVWQWRVPEGLSLIKSTFRSALDRMKEFPNYKFTSACAGYYKWIKVSEPEMFNEIQQRVKEGRWGVTGGMWVQPDCNIPSGEAFCRHFLYSQKFFSENFGFTVKTGYNVDSFGHNGMLPQLLKKSGIENYVYMRPNREAEKPELPKENLHLWKSPDSSTVKAFRILDGYGDDLKDKRVDRYADYGYPQMLFYGIGNHGGGPSKVHLSQAENLIAKGNSCYAVPDEYFENIDCDMPVVSDDLQHHAAGCYSANSAVKSADRRAECELVRAEKIDVLANLLTGSQLHSKSIENAWERVMFNQFHDILAGCSIKEAYDDALSAFGFAKETALEIDSFASQRISWRIKTTDYLQSDVSEMRERLWYRDGEGSPMVVFNPHSFPVKTAVSFGNQCTSRVVDMKGKDVPFQLVRASYTDGKYVNKCLFNAEIPAYGYKVYYLYKKEENSPETEFNSDLSISENTIENSKVKITINKNDGSVTSFIYKNKEFASKNFGKTIICDDELNDTWGHAVTDYNIYIGDFSEGKLEAVENGPVRITLKSTVYFHNSTLIRYYSLYANDEKLYVRCMLDFDEPYKLAKICFPVNIESPSVTYSMPYGFIEKKTDSQEEPCHTWCDICDENGVGMGLINDCKYSFCAVNNDLRMNIARSCAYLDHFGQKSRDGEMQFIDKGEQSFNYILVPHFNKCNYKLFKEGEILNTPVQLTQETHHDGSLPGDYSGISVNKENVVVTAIKAAEDGDGFILRAVECDGRETECEINFVALKKCFTLSFNPQEIKTVRISSDGRVIEEMIIE